MNRPWKTWLLFAVCLAVLLAAMGWVSLTMLRLDSAQTAARHQAAFEEKVRLALWRMDSTLAPLIAQESSHPYFAYRAFYAAERAYTRMFNEIQPKEVLIPSPLLAPPATNVLLYFQFSPEGELSSPQAPAGHMRDLALAGYLTRDQINVADQRLRQLASFLQRDTLARHCVPGPEAPMPALAQVRPIQKVQQLEAQPNAPMAQSDAQQTMMNAVELQARAQVYQQQAANRFNPDLNYSKAVQANISEGAIRPIWFGQALVLARRVSVNGRDYLQGCWLDWPSLAGTLLASVRDLLPAAKLESLPPDRPDQQGRMLASLPVRLVPGPAAPPYNSSASPLWFALLTAWTCVLLAAISVAVLLHGTLSLSERRAAFVSAVTHELRTPLTTFKMYSEMLAAGMIQDAEKRRHYLDTLCSEADRLSHLVENVLAYARLERGSARRCLEQVPLGELIQRVKPRLEQRAVQSNLTVVAETDPAVLAAAVHVDVSAVEQILFNLVDNACKYAAPSAREPLIHLEGFPDKKWILLRVRDHGQGIARDQTRKLFRPFSKSAPEAARTAPGVGLGLALCRRLIRSMGGDLQLDLRVQDGAAFVLKLPRACENSPSR